MSVWQHIYRLVEWITYIRENVMKKVKMTIKIEAATRKKLDALTVQSLMDGYREGYSLIIEKAVADYFDKHANNSAREHVKDPSMKPFSS